jgi:hypothetical protein
MEVGGGLPVPPRASVIDAFAGREPVERDRVACVWGELNATCGFGFSAGGENVSARWSVSPADGVEVVAGFGVFALACGFAVVVLFSVLAAGCCGAAAAGFAAGFGAGGGGGGGVTDFFSVEMAIAVSWRGKRGGKHPLVRRSPEMGYTEFKKAKTRRSSPCSGP